LELALGPIYFRQRGGSEATGFNAKLQIFATVYIACMLPLWVLAIVFCRDTIRLVAGEKYAAAAPICMVLLCATFVRMQLPFLTRQVHFLRKTWLLPAITIPSAVISLILTVILARNFGAVAAAWVTLATDLFILLTLAIAVRRFEDIYYPISTAVAFTILLAGLSAWQGAASGVESLESVTTRLTLVLVTATVSMAIWIWPNRLLICQLARG
jgi:O-antigen/teichoic acid export membrane protein